MITALTLLAFVLMLFGALILLTHDTDAQLLTGSIFLIAALVCGSIAGDLKRKTPEYKLWEKRQELEEKKRSSNTKSFEEQKQIWILKRSKELDDSLKLIK
jgi:hypothetical protein